MYCCCCNLTRNPPPAIPIILSSSSSSRARARAMARVRVSRGPPRSLCFNPSPSPQNFPSPSTFFPSLLKNSDNLDYSSSSSSSSSTTTNQVRPFTSSSSSSSSSSSARFLLRNYSNPTRVSPPTYFPTLGSIQTTLENKIGARVRFFSTASTWTGWEKNGGRQRDSTTLPWIAATAYEERQGKAGRREEKKKTNTQTGTNHSSWEISAERYFSRNNTNYSPKMVSDESRNNTSLVENQRNISSYGKVDRKGEEQPHHSRKRIIDNRRRMRSSSSWEGSERRTYFSRNGSKLSKENNRGNRDDDDDARVENQELRRRNTVGAKQENRGEEEAVEVEMKDAEPVNDPRWDGIKSKYRGFIDRESRFEKPEVRQWNVQENWGKKTWKEATESSLPKMVGQGVYGVGPVLAALTVERREFYALYFQQGLELGGNNRKKKDKKGVEKVFKLAEKMGLKVIEASKHDLNMVVDNRPHQGLVLDASPLELVNIKELEPPSSLEGQKAPLWVALDEVTDPQNLGAIVRSSYFFGVEGVVLCAKNSAPLSGVVSKASAGSLELIELRSCKNMMQFLSSSTENGWRVLGGSVSTGALPLSTVEAGVPTILVLGSEGTGLRPLVERSCTQLIRIPGNMSIGACPGENELEPEVVDQTHSGPELKSFLAVESLNVSVAAGVLLYHLVGSNSHLPNTKPEIAYE